MRMAFANQSIKDRSRTQRGAQHLNRRAFLAGTACLSLTHAVGHAQSGSVSVLVLNSDAWLREGPTTSHKRITGLQRGTTLIEIGALEDALSSPSDRWVNIYVLEGSHAGREGWVWGRFVECCETLDWMR